MVPQNTFSRRGLLTATGAAGVAVLAGCTGNGDGNGNGNGNGNGGGNGNGNGGNGDGNGNGNGGGNQYDWVIGTSGEETGTHASAVAFSTVLNENSDMINLSPRTTPGTTANPRLLDEGEIDVAQGTDINAWNANLGMPPLDDPPVEKTLCQALPWMTIEIIVLKRTDADLDDVETVHDIPEDVPMSWGPPGASAYVISELGFEIAGIENPADQYNLQNMELGDLPDALRAGRIDVSVALTLNQNSLLGYVQEMDSTNDLDVVSWDVTEEDVVSFDGPLNYVDVSSDIFSNDFSVDSTPGILSAYTTLFDAETPSEATYEFAEVLMDNHEELRGYHNSLANYGPEYTQNWMIRNENVPVHPGIQEYLEDNDLWGDDFPSLDDFEDTR